MESDDRNISAAPVPVKVQQAKDAATDKPRVSPPALRDIDAELAGEADKLLNIDDAQSSMEEEPAAEPPAAAAAPGRDHAPAPDVSETVAPSQPDAMEVPPTSETSTAADAPLAVGGEPCVREPVAEPPLEDSTTAGADAVNPDPPIEPGPNDEMRTQAPVEADPPDAESPVEADQPVEPGANELPAVSDDADTEPTPRRRLALIGPAMMQVLVSMLALISYPLRLIPESGRSVFDWLALSLVFWVPVVWIATWLLI